MNDLKDDHDDPRYLLQLLYKKLNAQQYGLKMIANVTYGYTSANFSGRMPCVEVSSGRVSLVLAWLQLMAVLQIADSIVQTGRETLENAIHMVNNTTKWGAKVIYGDTDRYAADSS